MAKRPGAAESDEGGEAERFAPNAAFRVQLPNFEGPLDLLLHLIREHRVDILDIPIALITEKYLEMLEVLRKLELDVAGEFLVMAATLAHIKSQMLLPRTELPSQPHEEPEERGDPREELVRRLLDYQRYKAAADELGSSPLLERDVFPRRPPPESQPSPEEVGLVEISVFKLIEAFDRAMKLAKVEIPHEVLVEHTSISDAISHLAEKLAETSQISFFSLFAGSRERSRLVVLFLAILEMTRLRLIRLFQEEATGDIVLRTASGKPLDVSPEVTDDYA